MCYHQDTDFHKAPQIKAEKFVEWYEGSRASVIDMLHDITPRMHQIEENLAVYVPIIETIKLCGRQELALRGQRFWVCINERTYH